MQLNERNFNGSLGRFEDVVRKFARISAELDCERERQGERSSRRNFLPLSEKYSFFLTYFIDG